MCGLEAKDLLDEVTQIKTATRARLHASGWQWLVVWSLAFLGAALTGLVPGWIPYSDVYWIYAVPVAVLLTVWVSWHFESRSPVRQRGLPYWLIGLGMTLSSFGLGLFLPDQAIVVVIWVIFGLGFAGFCWLERVTPAAWLMVGLAILSAVLGVVVEDTFELYPVLALAFSAALAGVIAGMFVQGRR
jgi:MFS family permease